MHVLGAYKPVMVESSELTKSKVMDELSGTCRSKNQLPFRLAVGHSIWLVVEVSNAFSAWQRSIEKQHHT